MNLIEFNTHYADESSCKIAWKTLREKEGIVCKKCLGKLHYWKKAIYPFDTGYWRYI